MKNNVEFRAWDGSRMHSWKDIKDTRGFHHCLFEKPRGVKLLQYVQAKDIKGKKIFEGDIIQNVNNGSKYIVKDLIDFHLWCNSCSIDTYLSHKIIGNVYQMKTST